MLVPFDITIYIYIRFQETYFVYRLSVEHDLLQTHCDTSSQNLKRTAKSVISVRKCPLQWCHNGSNGVSNNQPHDCLLKRLFRRRSKKTSKLRVTGLCEGNSPVTGEFPAQMASNAENVSIWWRHHAPINTRFYCEDTVLTSKTLFFFTVSWNIMDF